MKMAAKQVSGWALIVAGILGTLLPVVPGVLLIAAGVSILGVDHPLIRPWVDRIKGLRARVRRPPGSAVPNEPETK